MTPAKVWKVADKHTDNLLEQLYFNRGLNSADEIEKFTHPKLSNYEKELKIPNIKKAQERILKAIEKEELIVIYGDYDVDGVTASAIMYKALTSIGAKVLPYIPHREKEGYGMSKLGLDHARDSGATLVITVDNGIVALEQAKYAKEIGLDLIITDHHLPLDSGDLPEAYTIVHSTAMCGADVAWCLMRDLIDKSLATHLLQFSAVATICDMIPLTGVGRAFVAEGIKVLNVDPNLGFRQLIICSGAKLGEIDAYAIGHILGPRLNAIGRLEHAIDALRMLCTNDLNRARKLANLLCEANSQRQVLTTSAVDEAKLMIGTDTTDKIFVVSSNDWNPGVIGLIAARVTEEHYRPSIAISMGEKIAKGSARSVTGINIVEIIRQCSDLLIDVGGHTGAAGFSLDSTRVEEFKQKIREVSSNLPDDVQRVLEIEAEVESRKLTKTLVKEINKLEPFGFMNPQPLLVSRNMRISDIRTLSEGKHLKFKADGIDAIGFGMGEYATLLKEGMLVDLAYYLDINKFNGAEILQLRVKDLKVN